MALCFMEPQLLPIEVSHCENRDLLFCSCDLDLDPMTFIYELDLHSLESLIYTRCAKMNCLRQGFRKLSYTDIQTDNRNYTPRRFAGGQKLTVHVHVLPRTKVFHSRKLPIE